MDTIVAISDKPVKTTITLSSSEGETIVVSILAIRQSKSLKDVIEQFEECEIIPTAVPIKYLKIIADYLHETEYVPDPILENIESLRENGFPSRYTKYVTYESEDITNLITYSDMLGIEYLTELIAKHIAADFSNNPEEWVKKHNITNDLTAEEQEQIDKENDFAKNIA
jgi:hypothetical protein